MWAKNGSVTLTKGSNVVTGKGTTFSQLAEISDGFISHDGQLYEVVNIVSDTQLTLGENYKGDSGGNLAYAILPLRGGFNRATLEFQKILSEFGNILSAGLTIKPNASGTTADKALFDQEQAGFTFLDVTAGKFFVKLSSADKDWSEGMTVGGGAKGSPGPEGPAGPPVPVAHELGDDPNLAVSQKLLKDSIDSMEQSNAHIIAQVVGLDAAVSDLETSVSDLRSDLGASTISYNYTTHTYDLSKHRITSTHRACRRCLLSDDGIVNYYLDQHDSNKKEDGTTADLSGGDGQVMVEIPRFWFGVNHIGETIQITQSPIPLPGLIPHPVFTTGGDFDAVYVGAYNATVQQPDGTIIPGLNLDNNTARVDLEVDKLSSLSGGDNYAMVGLNLDEFRALANNRGEGWEEFSFLAWQALQVLGYTFLGNFNGQVSLGNGNVSKSYPASSSIQSDSPHILNGASNTLGNEAGATNDFMSLLGVENLWGQCWQWVDGVLFQDAQAYVSAVPASTITEDYYPVGSPISQAGDSGSYISEFQKLVNFILIPGAGSGNSSRFVGDSFWWSGGLRGALVGGHASYGARCGLACLSAYYAPGLRLRSVGGRVMFKRSRG